MGHPKVVLDEDDVRRTLVRIAHEIVEKNPDGAVALVGIHRRGAHLATRLHRLVSDLLEGELPAGDIDIAFYRDDLAHARGARGPLEPPAVPARGPHDGARRRRALHGPHGAGRDRGAVRLGRPARVQLAVLADRGHRELPIRPDYVGKNLPTHRAERVNVHVAELDGADEVTITSRQEARA